MKRQETIYLLSHNLSWKTFKKLQASLVCTPGPTPVHGDRMIWELMRDEKLYCWFASDMPHDMGISLRIPLRYKDYRKKVLTNK